MADAPLVPTSSYLGVGATTPTIFGAGPPASIHAALSDLSGSTPVDSTGVHAGTTPSYNDRTFFTVHSFVTPPGGWTFNYVYIRFRGTFLASTHGYWYPATLIGIKPDGTRHQRSLSSGPPGPGSTTVHQVDTAISTFAVDGTPWGDCEEFEVEWKVAYDTDFVGEPWDATNYPTLTYVAVVINPLYTPTAINPEPNSTVAVSQPEISWTTGNGPHSSYRIIIVPDGAEDADGTDAGDASFDPTTSDDVAYDSGRVFSTDHGFVLPDPLTNGIYWTYPHVWAGYGANIVEQVGWDEFDTFTIDGDTVDQPSVTLTNDSASYTVLVTITAGAAVTDHVAAAIQVQRWDFEHEVWRPAPVEDSLVSGTGVSAFYDGLTPPGGPVRYRARGVYITGAGALFVSAWDTENGTAANLEEHWLRSTTDHTLNRSMQDNAGLMVKTWKTGRDRPQTASYGLGARVATVTADVMKGNLHSLTVWAMGEDAYNGLRNLLDGGDDLVLVSQWGEVWRCQVGPQVSEDWMPAAPTGVETTPLGLVRVFDFSLIEVVTP